MRRYPWLRVHTGRRLAALARLTLIALLAVAQVATQSASAAGTPTKPPLNFIAPAISGTAAEGDTLTTTKGAWLRAPESFAYAWDECNASGEDCAPISGAAQDTYTPALAQVGHEIRSVVTATNAVGSTTAESSPTAAVAIAPPANTAPPVITGTAKVGDTLSASTGTWSNDPTGYSYSWKSCSGGSCTAIAGATAATYTISSAEVGDTLQVAVQASNAAGSSAPATSSATGAVAAASTSPSGPAPTNTSAPAITGHAQVGDTLTASPGGWSNSPTSYSYQWKDCSAGSCTAIAGASTTSGTYTVQAGDAHDAIEVAVTATNPNGTSAAVASAETSAVVAVAPVNIAPPSVAGSPNVGSTLSADTGSWSGSPTGYSYAWQDCNSAGCTAISGATSSSYTVKSSDAGDRIAVTVTAANAGGSVGATATPTAAVGTAPALTSSAPPAISGSAVAGDQLTAATGTWSGTGDTYSYQWNDCLIGYGGACTPISGATGSTYTVQSGDEGFAIDVTVTAKDSGGSTAANSLETPPVAVPPANAAVSIAGIAVPGSALTASDHWAGTSLAYSYQWFDCSSSGGSCSTIAGATGNAYVVAPGDEGHSLEVRVTAANAAGSVAATSAATPAVPTVIAGSGAPTLATAPAISGTAAEGDTLTVSVGQWQGAPTSYTFQWLHCSGGSCTNISTGANSYAYVPSAGDVGDTIEAKVTATNASGSTSTTSAATAAVSASGTAPSGVTISGADLVNDKGSVIEPHGADRSGTEYACWQFDAISDGPIDAASVAAMATWNLNMVRVQLNEDCWLGINGVPANVSGQNYITAIENFVSTLHQYGMYAYISLMSGHPGSTAPDNNEPNAPDEDHSPLFWKQLATAFRNDPNVILAPQSETTVSWSCYIEGCSNQASYTGGPYDGLGSTGSGSWYYQSAGMSQAIEIIRAAGFNGPISVPCINWANECADYSYETDAGSWLTEVPGLDPDSQVMAEIHTYQGQVCSTAACYTATLSPIISAGYPVIAGETGPSSGGCASAAESTILPALQADGIGWLSYAWDVYSGSCSTLITSYEPATANTGGYAAAVQSFDMAQPG